MRMCYYACADSVLNAHPRAQAWLSNITFIIYCLKCNYINFNWKFNIDVLLISQYEWVILVIAWVWNEAENEGE